MLSQTPSAKSPLTSIRELHFSDGSQILLEGNELVVFVGPNNAGKSAALRDIAAKFRSEDGQKVIPQLSKVRSGTAEEAFNYFKIMAQVMGPEAIQLREEHTHYGLSLEETRRVWSGELKDSKVDRFLLRHLRVDDRVSLANNCESFAPLRQGPSKPAHYIFLDEKLEHEISRHFRAAFDQDFVLNRGGGNQIEILCGQRPNRDPGEEYYHRSFQEKLSKLQPVSEQGDGMRCFAGIVMTALCAPYPIILIDEPEAFLHPPQAVHLGRLLAEERALNSQFFLATHSSDLLRGILNTPGRNVKIIRLQRHGNINQIRLMDNSRVRTLWQDSLLRYSNILDGLFHERVVICEGDADCRYYAAIFDALRGHSSKRLPDVLFSPVFGKSRCEVALKAMHAIGVPAVVALDFDSLNDPTFLKSLVVTQGGDWSALDADYNVVVSAVASRQAGAAPWSIRKEMLQREISGIAGAPLLPGKLRELRELLDPPGPWREAKRLGEAFLPAGDVLARWKTLREQLDKLGIFIVDVGELESWDRNVSSALHGPAWVEQALQKDLLKAVELKGAREFVLRLTGVSV